MPIQPPFMDGVGTMPQRPIAKSPATFPVTPHLQNYADARQHFSWSAAREELDGLPGNQGLNIAHEAIDRHCTSQRGNKVALRWLGKEGEARDFTFQELRQLTNRFANFLNKLGILPGDRVFGLAGRIPELYITALGTLKHRGVFCPLFSAFGPEPIRARLRIGEARVLVTTQDLYQKKIAALRDSLPQLEYVLIVGERHEIPEGPGLHNLHQLLEEASADYTIGPTDPQSPALLHFTSGTTGTPKGALHVHEAVVAHHITGKLVLDLHESDIFWCTADPGWVTGTSYGIIAP